jgi:hypothetical protein
MIRHQALSVYQEFVTLRLSTENRMIVEDETRAFSSTVTHGIEQDRSGRQLVRHSENRAA